MASTFDDFKIHKREFKYLSNVMGIKMGNGYSFMSKPISPMLKEFTLHFTGYRYYFNNDGSIDYETNKNKNNLGALCQFYEEMNQCTTFIYNDSQFGAVNVRFAEPLVIPQTMGNRAVAEDFTIVLEEVA